MCCVLFLGYCGWHFSLLSVLFPVTVRLKENWDCCFLKEASGDLELEISPNRRGEELPSFKCLWKMLEREYWYVFHYTWYCDLIYFHQTCDEHFLMWNSRENILILWYMCFYLLFEFNRYMVTSIWSQFLYGTSATLVSANQDRCT